MSNFHPLEIVGRGSETHIQVSEYLNKNRLRYIYPHHMSHTGHIYIYRPTQLLTNVLKVTALIVACIIRSPFCAI